MAVVGPSRSFLSGASSGPLVDDGQVQLILGPMFAGKTSELLRRTRRYKQYKKCLLIAYKGDNRYSSDASVITHDQTEMKAKCVERLSEVENAAHSYNVIGIDEGQFFPGMPRMDNTGHQLRFTCPYKQDAAEAYHSGSACVCLFIMSLATNDSHQSWELGDKKDTVPHQFSIVPADIVEYAERWANEGKIVIISALDGTFQRKPFNSILELIPLAEEVLSSVSP